MMPGPGSGCSDTRRQRLDRTTGARQRGTRTQSPRSRPGNTAQKGGNGLRSWSIRPWFSPGENGGLYCGPNRTVLEPKSLWIKTP